MSDVFRYVILFNNVGRLGKSNNPNMFYSLTTKGNVIQLYFESYFKIT